MQAKLIPGVLIVTPDWILKCARTWCRVSEHDFLADEWKAKHAKKESAKQEVNADVSVKADAPAETPSATSTSTSGDDISGSKPSAAVSLAAEGKPAMKDLADQQPGDAKRGKQVTFADDVANPSSDDGTEKIPSTVRKSRVIRRSPGARPARTTHAVGGVATGVVATGGTFDFLSKISAIKRGPATSVKAEKTKVTTKDRARPVSPPKVHFVDC